MEPAVESHKTEIKEELMTPEQMMRQTAHILKFVEIVIEQHSTDFGELELEKTAVMADKISTLCKTIVDRRRGKK